MANLQEKTQPGVSPMQHAEATSKVDQVLARHLQGKVKEWTAVVEKNGPLQLLDLPVDILREIVNHITHTNDLTSLALTHSALHALATPQVYSRFDIVWPDAHAALDNRSGVDALTYGLATLVMAQDVFGEARSQRLPNHQYHRCSHCGQLDQCSHTKNSTNRTQADAESINQAAARKAKIRRGNNFAEYTRKFSLGNGPAEWVQEYQINKEGGKMLGTLVALAVGRMRNLETFIWDMPTGILRDIWLALASLGNREDGQECRLERIWVRWHDNSDVLSPTLSAAQMAANPILVPPTASSANLPPVFHIPPYPRVEFPTFSILPPLKSLSVLDIDELPYAEEMSVLIERSVHKLRELRLGVAQHARLEPWVRPQEDQLHAASISGNTSQVHHSSRPGGILGLLVSRFCDAYRPIKLNLTQNDPFAPKDDVTESLPSELHTSDTSSTVSLQQSALEIPVATEHSPTPEAPVAEEAGESVADGKGSAIAALTSSLAAHQLNDGGQIATEVLEVKASDNSMSLTPGAALGNEEDVSTTPRPATKSQPRKLKLELETLELERVPISITVLSRAMDWSRLTCLTILGCRHHEQLWKALRKQFSPPRRHSSTSNLTRPRSSSATLDSTPRRSADDFPLRIRRLHTDAVSSSLITFIKETLAPDSLESLFLQDDSEYKSTVSIDTIYRGTLRRHRRSLKKVLIESEDKSEEGPPQAWRRWIFNKDILGFITSQMPNLRELGMAVDYKDWHFFLQRLANATQLRSLFIPYVADHVNGRSDSRELGMQVLDIVALRPELELCYLGIQSKCFEILEYPVGRRASVDYASAVSGGAGDSGASDDEDAEGQQAAEPAAHASIEEDDSDSEVASSRGADTDVEDEHAGQATKQFKLREILFYDDKVSIFKARHGKL